MVHLIKRTYVSIILLLIASPVSLVLLHLSLKSRFTYNSTLISPLSPSTPTPDPHFYFFLLKQTGRWEQSVTFAFSYFLTSLLPFPPSLRPSLLPYTFPSSPTVTWEAAGHFTAPVLTLELNFLLESMMCDGKVRCKKLRVNKPLDTARPERKTRDY